MLRLNNFESATRATSALPDAEQTSSILPEDGVFYRYTGRLLRNDIQPPTLSHCQTLSYYALKTASLSLGTLSGLAYLQPAVEFAGHYRIYGYFLGYGIFTSLSVVTTWALNEVSNDFLSENKKEQEIMDQKHNVYRDILYWFFVPAFAASSSFPVSYLVYTSNNKNLFIALGSEVADTITNTCSLNRLYSAAKIKFLHRSSASRHADLREEFIVEMRKSLEILPSLPQMEFKALQRLIESNNPQAFLEKFLQLSHAQLTVIAEHATWFEGLPKKIATAVSFLFPLAWSIFSLRNAYDSFDIFFQEVIAKWPLSILSTLPYLILEIMLASQFVSKVYDSAVQHIFNIYNPSIAEQFYPKHYLAAAALGLFTTLNAYGARANFITEKFSGWEAILLGLMVCISTVSYKSSAMLEIINLAFNKFSIWFSRDSRVKEMCVLIERLNSLIALVENASPEKFAKLSEEFKLETLVLQKRSAELHVVTVDDLQPTEVTTTSRQCSVNFWRDSRIETRTQSDERVRLCGIV